MNVHEQFRLCLGCTHGQWSHTCVLGQKLPFYQMWYSTHLPWRIMTIQKCRSNQLLLLHLLLPLGGDREKFFQGGWISCLVERDGLICAKKLFKDTWCQCTQGLPINAHYILLCVGVWNFDSMHIMLMYTISLYSLIWDFLLSQINIWTTTTWSNVWVVLPKPSWY